MNKILSLCFLLFWSQSALASWTLNNEQSSVNFVSIKKSSIGEIHRFNGLKGALDNGVAQVTIDLSSVDTKIPIRDERMKTMLFNVAQFPKVIVKAAFDESKIEGLAVGSIKTSKVVFSVSLHGITKEIPADVQIVKLSTHQMMVNSAAPMIVLAADFGLHTGVEALRKVANLPVISTAVPLTFSLIFTK